MNIKHEFNYVTFEYESSMITYHCCKTVRTTHVVNGKGKANPLHA
jgi:hypothetical protein